jgi:hypothetical protein
MSVAPTASPSCTTCNKVVIIIISFCVNVQLDNCSSYSSSYDTILAQILASLSNGLFTSADVTTTSTAPMVVTAYSQYLAVDTTKRNQEVVSNSTIVSLIVTLPSSTLSQYSNGWELFNMTSSMLTTAVNDGTFQSELEAAAESSGDTVLAQAVPSSVAFSNVVVEQEQTSNEENDTDNSTSLNTQEIAGVVIAVVFGVILLSAMGAYYYRSQQRKEHLLQEQQQQDASLHYTSIYSENKVQQNALQPGSEQTV